MKTIFPPFPYAEYNFLLFPNKNLWGRHFYSNTSIYQFTPNPNWIYNWGKIYQIESENTKSRNLVSHRERGEERETERDTCFCYSSIWIGLGLTSSRLRSWRKDRNSQVATVVVARWQGGVAAVASRWPDVAEVVARLPDVTVVTLMPLTWWRV